ncbi:unnamed protein product, partial [Ascophyllum nodosum]
AATNSGKEIKNIFTELRKAANHPLLLRRKWWPRDGSDVFGSFAAPVRPLFGG